MKAKLVKESNELKEPDYFSGMEFGKKRNDFSDVPHIKISPTKQKKLDALNKKAEKIMKKWGEDKFFEVTVRKHAMGKNEKVRASEALDLLDKAKANVRRTGETLGIIIYV